MNDDFAVAREFLNDNISASELYDDVCAAIDRVQDIEYGYGETKASQEIFSTLLLCADFLQTISPEKCRVLS